MDVDILAEEHVDRIFRALSDATRRDIIRRSLHEEATVSELARDYDMSFAAVQKHIAVLEAAELVSKTPIGRERRVRGNPATLRKTQEILDHFEHVWRKRIDRLDALIEAEPHSTKPAT